MFPLDLSNCSIMDSKGNVVKLSEVKTVEIKKGFPYNDEKYAGIAECAEASFTIHAIPARSKGMLDCLTRPYTSAAYRYRRWVKRQKEKERRRKLKHDCNNNKNIL